MIGKSNATTIIGGTSQGNLEVRYWDIDGTLLKTQFVNSGENTTPPANPTRTDLTFDEWNIPSTNVQSHLDIGATYYTTNGRTIIYLKINSLSGYQPTLQFVKQGTTLLTVYWGDGTTSTTSSSGAITLQKGAVYAANGLYKIEIDYSTNTISGNNTYWFTSNNYNKNVTKIYLGNHCTSIGAYWVSGAAYQQVEEISINRNYSRTSINVQEMYYLKAAILPRGLTQSGNMIDLRNAKVISIPQTINLITANISGHYTISRLILPLGATYSGVFWATNNNFNLETLVLPTSFGTIPQSFISSCYKVKTIVNFPTAPTTVKAYALQNTTVSIDSLNLANCTVIETQSFNTALGVKSIITPTSYTNTTIGSYSFASMNVESITFNSGPTIIGDRCLQNGLWKYVDLPSTVTTINQYALYNCPLLSTLVVRATTPPTLGTGALPTSNTILKIYVPDANVAAYQAASGWSTYSAQIFPLSSL